MVCKLPFRICKSCGYSTTCTRVHRLDKMSKHKCYLLKSHKVPRCPGKRHPVLTQATTGPLGILQDLLCCLKQGPHHFSDTKNLPVATRTRRYSLISHKHILTHKHILKHIFKRLYIFLHLIQLHDCVSLCFCGVVAAARLQN